MISPVYSTERLSQEMTFDEFNLIVTAIKITGDDRWERLVKFTHVIRDKETGKMLERVRTQLYLNDLIEINKMETRLRYDKQLLESSLNKMENFTEKMLVRDKAFYEKISSNKK